MKSSKYIYIALSAACYVMPALAQTTNPNQNTASPISSGKLFNISGAISNVTPTGITTNNFAFGMSNASDALQFLSSPTFTSNAPSYQGQNSGIAATIGFRGVPINVAFQINSSNLTVNVPAIGLSQSFNGGNRDASLNLLKDYLLLNSGSIIRAFQRALIKASPNDPTAGNPNSLQSTMVAQDFNTGGFDTAETTPDTSGEASGNGGDKGAGVGSNNRIILGAQAGTFKAQGVKGKSVLAPLSYVVRFDRDPRYQLQFGMPISYVEQEGAKSVSASFSLGFQFPLLKYKSRNQWYLIPRASVGGTGSADAAAASILSNYSLTSRYAIPIGRKDQITIANMVAYSKSVPFKIKEFRGDYGINNIIFKNGLLYKRKLGFKLFGSSGTSLQTSYAYTKFTGTDLYMNNYHEFSASIGTVNRKGFNSLFRVGLIGEVGRNFNKLGVNLGYNF